jgi:site-specific DNA-methyltransferase (adenine-specific)
MNSRFTLHHGDNREVLKTFEDNSVDSIVCDPPYELGFMGKKWDSTGIAYDVSLWAECLRVLKPGGHLIAFGGTRTYHRMTCAIEDAGFEIRDSVIWMYGSGFPKSHNVSKAIDATIQLGGSNSRKLRQTEQDTGGKSYKLKGRNNGILGEERTYDRKEWSPVTPEAQQWSGWGTALKPAIEPAVLARKPLIGTVADNVLAWSVGGINIDGCRIATDDNLNGGAYASSGTERNDGWGMQRGGAGEYVQPSGRWPANIILDEESAKMIDEQSGERKGMSGGGHRKQKSNIMPSIQVGKVSEHNHLLRNDIGGASRFFYVAKASKSEREAGLDEMELKIKHTQMRSANGTGEKNFEGGFTDSIRANTHPTVKPITLMRYLVRLVTPKDGVVLDPFMGSGSTGCASMLEGMRFIGIEINEEYMDIAQRRIEHWLNQNPMGL